MFLRCLVLTASIATLLTAQGTPNPAQATGQVGTSSPLPAVANLQSSEQLIEGSLTVRNENGTALFLRSTPPSGTTAIAFDARAEITDVGATQIDVVGARLVADGTSFSSSSVVNVVGLDVSASAFAGGGSSPVCGVKITALGNECNGAIGVDALGDASTGVGIACGIGVNGRTNGSSAFSYGVFASGNLGATGDKNFIHPHPQDASLAIRFSTLEGAESGTYFRGTATIQNGRAEILVEDGWRLASEEDGVTVQLTAVGGFAQLYVAEQTRERIVVHGDADVTFNYFVNGVRRGFSQHETIVENRFFVPTFRGVPFGSQYPNAIRDILVENGILYPDYTPNLETARSMGWELQDPEEVPLENRWWLSAQERQRLKTSR